MRTQTLMKWFVCLFDLKAESWKHLTYSFFLSINSFWWIYKCHNQPAMQLLAILSCLWAKLRKGKDYGFSIVLQPSLCRQKSWFYYHLGSPVVLVSESGIPRFMALHPYHKRVFVTREWGHLAFPPANKRSDSPPFLWFCLAQGVQTKVQRLELFTGKRIKDSFALILLWHKGSHFFVKKNVRADHFFKDKPQTKRSIVSLI